MEAFTGKRTAPGSDKHTHIHTCIYINISDGKVGFLLGKLTKNIKSPGQAILLISVTMNLTAAKPQTSDTWLHPVLWKSCSIPGWTPGINCCVCVHACTCVCRCVWEQREEGRSTKNENSLVAQRIDLTSQRPFNGLNETVSNSLRVKSILKWHQ